MDPNEIQVIEDKVGNKGIYNKMKKNPWILVSAVLFVLVVILLLMNPNISGRITGQAVSGQSAAEDLLAFYEANGAEGLTIDSVESESGLYKINFEFQGQIVPIYMTKDGTLAGSLSPIVAPTQQTQQTQEIPKSDNPKVELFVMTHCPYGTQAEKGFIQAINVLPGVDTSIKFVHYFMHEPEETETPRQVCIREEQGDKYLDYLSCFLEGDGNADASGYMANGNDPEVCMQRAGIDVVAVQSCIDSGKADEYYADDSAASQAAGVSGSPTLVINGGIVNSGRSAVAYLSTICSAFTDESRPSTCDTAELSSTSPSPGFGYAEGEATAAQC